MGEPTGNSRKSGNGTLLIIVTIISALVAAAGLGGTVLGPMRHEIESLKEDIGLLRIALDRHDDKDSHAGVAARLAAMHEKFVEIETQFKGERKILALYQDGDLRHQLMTDGKFRELEKALLWKDGVK